MVLHVRIPLAGPGTVSRGPGHRSETVAMCLGPVRSADLNAAAGLAAFAAAAAAVPRAFSSGDPLPSWPPVDVL